MIERSGLKALPALSAMAASVAGPVDLLREYRMPNGFLFGRRGRGVATTGVARRIVVPGGPDQVARAAELAERALAGIRWDGGHPPIVVGALPFDGRTPATLTVPAETMVTMADDRAWRVSVSSAVDGRRSEGDGRGTGGLGGRAHRASRGGPDGPDGPDGSVDSDGPDAAGDEGIGGVADTRSLDVTPIPAPDVFADAVARARGRIGSGEMEKVVLARMLVVRADRDFDRRRLLERLREREPDAYTFAVHGWIGASPELLVSRFGLDVVSNPLAGTARRGGTEPEDRAAAESLLRSAKDRSEHTPVVDAVARGLAPACRSLTVPPEPSVLPTGTVWHLSTRIEGLLRRPPASALRLASLLHPTPAVCGTPPDRAMQVIHDLEPFDRTLYAGIVGWMDANGDGEWAVALRCAEVQGAMASLFAGAGIVADSDPEAEVAETDAKFASMLGALDAGSG